MAISRSKHIIFPRCLLRGRGKQSMGQFEPALPQKKGHRHFLAIFILYFIVSK